MDRSAQNETREQLLTRWRESGDPDALDQLLRVDLESVKRSFRKRLGNRKRSPTLDTSDYVDEAVGRMLRQSPAPNFETPENLRAYLAQAAVNLYINHYNSSGRKPITVSVEDLASFLEAPVGRTLSKDLDLREFSSTFELALNLLDEEESQLLHLHFLQKLSVRELAEKLAVPKSTIGRRIEHAKSNLVLKMMSWRKWLTN